MAAALNPEPAAGLPGVSSCYVLCHCHAALHKVHLRRCCTLTSHWSSVTSPCQHHKHQEACYHALSKTHALLHSTKVAHSMKMLQLDATALPDPSTTLSSNEYQVDRLTAAAAIIVTSASLCTCCGMEVKHSQSLHAKAMGGRICEAPSQGQCIKARESEPQRHLRVGPASWGLTPSA